MNRDDLRHLRNNITNARQRGFTLVEMLVATVVTLLMVAALAQAFAVISDTISQSRASIEMAGQLRGTTLRLQQDLNSLTAPVQPWLPSSAGLGYFEYVEGPGSDMDPATFVLGGAGAGPIAQGSHHAVGDVDDILAFTIRSFDVPFVGTVHRAVLGLGPPTPLFVPVESDTAEVIWWTMLNDYNRNEVWDPGEHFTIHRRLLLVKPELNSPTTGMLTLPATYDPAAPNSALPLHLSLFYNENDVSVHPVVDPGNGQILGFAANSLSDLTLRQNRFGHHPVDDSVTPPVFRVHGRNPLLAANLSNPYILSGFIFLPSRAVAGTAQVWRPYEVSVDADNPASLTNLVKWGVNRGADNEWGNAGQDDDGDGTTDNRTEALAASSDDMSGLYFGEDVMLANVLAFDVKVIDPQAPLLVHPGQDLAWGAAGVDDDNDGMTDEAAGEAGFPRTDDIAVGPADGGWAWSSPPPPLPLPQVGIGASVDLGYVRWASTGPTAPEPVYSIFRSGTTRVRFQQTSALVPTIFGGVPPFIDLNGNNIFDPSNTNREGYVSFMVPTYDTWPTDYELDGVDQDAWISIIRPMSTWRVGADQGTNGQEDSNPPPPAIAGVDDISERETAAPYDIPLRGIQVRIRIIDPDTRQVRQMTVAADFTPE